MAIRITCINKAGGQHLNPHHAIERLGWMEDGSGRTGISTRLEVWDWLTNKNGSAYVRDARGNSAEVRPCEHGQTRWVQTVADGRWSDNLLALPECF